MRISKLGLELIKQFEGLRLKAYRCSAGVWTIGYGHTRNVYPGMQISEDTAFALLLEDIWYVEEGINDLVQVPLNQNQFDALCSFSFNVGLDIDDDLKAEGLGDSTLLRKLNKGDYLGAANEFIKWDKAKGKKIAGLSKRRLAERTLFLTEE